MSFIKPTDAGQKFLSKQATPADRTAISAVQLYEKQVGSDGASGNTVYSLHKPYLPGTSTLWVFVNGAKVVAGEDYTETNALTVTFGSALSDTDVVEFMVVGGYRADSEELANALLQLPSNNNLFINGCLRVWQRGTTFSSGDEFGPDRWLLFNKTSATATFAYTPTGGVGPVNAISVTRDTTGASPGILQRIEGRNVRFLAGKQLTLSFWATSTVGTSGLSVQLKRAGSLDDFSSPTLVETGTIWSSGSGPTGWTKYTYTFDALPAEAQYGIEVRLYRGNAEASTTAYCLLKLEEGNVATPFEFPAMGDVLSQCQRYYEGGDFRSGAIGASYAASYLRTTVPYLVEKRTFPTVTVAVAKYYTTTWVNAASITVTEAGTEWFTLTLGGSFTVQGGYIIDGGWTADAEL